MKSLFSVMDVIEFDLHSDRSDPICRVSQNRLLENFRKIAWLLRHEIAAINPPCLSASNSEKKALDYLIDNLVLSQLSDEPNSGEQQMARKIAHHLDVDSDEEEDPPEPVETEEVITTEADLPDAPIGLIFVRDIGGQNHHARWHHHKYHNPPHQAP